MAENSNTKKRKYCQHCNEYVDKRTYRLHFKMFYDPNVKMWQKISNDLPVDLNEVDVLSFDKSASQQNQPDENLTAGTNDGIPQKDSYSESIHEHEDCDDHSISCGDEDDGSAADEEEWAYMEIRNQEILPEVWDLEEEEINSDFAENGKIPFVESSVQTSTSDPSTNLMVQHVAKWTILFLYMWSSFCTISNNALDILLAFLKSMFDALASIFSGIGIMAAMIPTSLHLLHKKLGISEDQFTKYVVCKSCNFLYCFDDCYETRLGKLVTKKCDYVAYPHHRQHFRRKTCNEPLLKEVTLKNGKVRLYPFKVYCYRSIIRTLQTFLKRSGFAAKCELWRERDIPSGILADVFDGRIWKEWQYIDNKAFLAQPHNYAFMLNCDWFQPFKHSVYSVGALYMVLLNLPRAERFKPENVFLVGIIPGPHEPKYNINSFLKPLVEELKILWDRGVALTISGKQQTVHSALICVGCDVPATRKLCGFTAHSSSRGCSKCTKIFTGNVQDGMDYSGFDPEPHRSCEIVREQAQDILNQTSATDQAEKEREYGVRFSELLLLPYFDPVKFHIIDPMHCLFTGTAKHMMQKIWLDEERPLLSKKNLKEIQNKLDGIQAPSSIGRMPRKIENSYGGFTADQWKCWTILFSIYSLWDILPTADLEMWREFVLACSFLCTPLITEGRARLAHAYILNFARKFEELYGKMKVTPNMHLQTHILDCILDYGPVYSFWLFSFERYNGMIADAITNQKAVEIQLMRKFTSDLYVKDIPLPKEFHDIFQPVMEKLVHQDVGTVGMSTEEYNLSRHVIDTSLLSIGSVRVSDRWSVNNTHQLYRCFPPQYKGCLTFDQLTHLQDAYEVIIPGVDRQSVTRFYEQFASVAFAGEQFGSSKSRRERSSFVTARWCGNRGQIDTSGTNLRPGVIDFFLKQNIVANGELVTCILASVRWFQSHQKRNTIGQPAEVWCKKSFEVCGPATFIPIQRIYSRFIPAFETIQREQVLVVCPVPRKLQC